MASDNQRLLTSRPFLCEVAYHSFTPQGLPQNWLGAMDKNNTCTKSECCVYLSDCLFHKTDMFIHKSKATNFPTLPFPFLHQTNLILTTLLLCLIQSKFKSDLRDSFTQEHFKDTTLFGMSCPYNPLFFSM